MIFDFILNVIAFLLRGVAALLPTFQVFPSSLAPDIADLVSYVYGWSWIFPVDTLFTIFAILVLLVFAEFVYFTSMWVLSLIHASIK